MLECRFHLLILILDSIQQAGNLSGGDFITGGHSLQIRTMFVKSISRQGSATALKAVSSAEELGVRHIEVGIFHMLDLFLSFRQKTPYDGRKLLCHQFCKASQVILINGGDRVAIHHEAHVFRFPCDGESIGAIQQSARKLIPLLAPFVSKIAR